MGKSIFEHACGAEYDYSKISKKEIYELKIVGITVAQGAKGEYLNVTARSEKKKDMPSVRGILSTAGGSEFKVNAFQRAIGQKKGDVFPSKTDLIGKKFKATLDVHDNPNVKGQKFIDVVAFQAV